MLWGLSPALDLLEEYQRVHALLDKGKIRILLLGSIDGRHVLQTLSRWRRHNTDVQLEFYILDLAMELVARQMLLLTVALEPEEKLGLHEKARLWMELYGNTLLRASSAKYLIHKAGQLIRMVTDRDFLKRRMPLLELEDLRYKELDQLENIFKYWMDNKYSLAKIWDRNLRKHLETRYDTRMGVFDWDYNMKLLDIQDGKRVCPAEYKHWRNTGVAFTWLETEYRSTNPTLAVGIGMDGDQLYSLGYMGDMESGPFFGFGTTSEEKELLQTNGGYNIRRATDITERNLQRIFFEIEKGSAPSDLYTADIDMGLVMTDPGKVDLEEDTGVDYRPDRTPEEYTAIPTQSHRVHFLPLNALKIFINRPKYQEFFDMVYVAQNYFKFLSEEILPMLKMNCPVVVETRKFVIAYNKEIGAFERDVKDKVKVLGGKEVSKCHYRRHSHALYKVNISNELEKEDTQSDEEGGEGTREENDLRLNESQDSHDKIVVHDEVPEEITEPVDKVISKNEENITEESGDDLH